MSADMTIAQVLKWIGVDTAIGRVVLVVSARGVRNVLLNKTAPPATVDEVLQSKRLAGHAGALCELIKGTRRDFPFPLDLTQGTDFQRRVWRALLAVPWGHVVTYGELAQRMGLPVGASRAIGQANAANPLPILIPCHRVVAAGGRLGGYSGGLETKRFLLRREGITPPR